MSVLAILAVLFLAVVFIIAIVIRKKKQLTQQLEEEKVASEHRYSSDSSYQANVINDEQVTYAYTAIVTPQTANTNSI